MENPDYENDDHLPANMAWLDRLIDENKARRATFPTRPSLRLLPAVERTQGSSIRPVLRLVPKEELNRCSGAPTIIKISYEIELALNYFRAASDHDSLLEVEPHLRRLSRIVNQLTRAAARARNREDLEQGLFD